MSTKIYTGFRLHRSNWTDAHALVTHFREILAASIREAVCADVACAAASMIDKRTLGEPTPGGRPISRALVDISQVTLKPNCDIVFYPHAGRVYGTVHASNDDFASAWFALSGVERYPYWNNTDPPEDVTDDEWDARKDVWDAILGYDPPSYKGFTASCVHPHPVFPTREEILARIPTLAERAQSVVIDRLYHEYVAREVNDGESNGNGSDWSGGVSNMVHRYQSFLAWSRTAGAASVAAAVAAVTVTLKPEITEDDLTREYAEPRA